MHLPSLTRVSLNLKAAYTKLAADGLFQSTQPVYISSTCSLAFVPLNIKFGTLVPVKRINANLSLPVFKSIAHLSKYLQTQSTDAAGFAAQGKFLLHNHPLDPDSNAFKSLDALALRLKAEMVNVSGTNFYVLDRPQTQLPLYPDLENLAEAETPPVCFTKGAVGQDAVDASCFGLTHIGSGKRTGNEDCLILDKKLLLVCDGMGGHSQGEAASHLASRITYFCLKLGLPFNLAISVAHQAIKDFNSSNRSNSGSTLVGAMIKDNFAHVFHVGDSRAYLFTAFNQQLFQLTLDHSLLYDFLRQTNDALKHLTLPLHETFQAEIERVSAGLGIRNVIMQTLGLGDITASSIRQRLSRNDILLLCSDGLSGPLGYKGIKTAIISALLKGASLQQMGQDLISSCLGSSESEDNITLALYRH